MQEPRDNPIDEAALSRGALLRAAADGEASGASLRGDGDAQARMAFEKSLREAVGRSMAGGAAPEGLRGRVLSAMRAEGSETATAPARRAGPDVAGWIRGHGKLAALLALALSLGVFMVWRSSLPTASERVAMDTMATMLQAEGERHARFGESFERFVPYKGEAAAQGAMAEVLGEDVPVRDLGSLGYSVAGLAPCSLSWPGRSGVLMYRSNEGPGWLTLVMNRFPAERTARPLSERVVSVLSGAAGTGKPPVFIWRKGDVVFYLVAPSESEARRALGALGAPGTMRAFDPDRAWTKQYSGGHE